MHIQGDGFLIRDYHLDDIPRVAEIGNNYKIWINLTHLFPHPYTIKDAEGWVGYNVGKGDQALDFAIEVDGQFAGGCGYKEFSGCFSKTIEIGYRLGEEYRGRGLASKICKALSDYAFNQYDIIKIEAKVFGWNPASMKVLEKNGYTHEGVIRQRIWKDEKITDEVFFGLLRSEWKNLK